MFSRMPDSPRLLAKTQSHQPFFERLDTSFECDHSITQTTLLQQFSTGELRRFQLPMTFFNQHVGLTVSETAKQNASDEDRIVATLFKAKSTECAAQLAQFKDRLVEKGLQLKTVRMYLATAAAFCEARQWKAEQCTNGQIEHFLAARPGVRNNLSPFVAFCREALGWDVSMPQRGGGLASITRPSRTVEQLRVLIDQVAKKGIEDADRKTLAAILALALGVAKATILRLPSTAITVNDDAVELQLGDERVALPAELVPYGVHYARFCAQGA